MEQVAVLSSATLAYEIDGAGPALVWCHGLASCREGDRDVTQSLAEHFTVLSYDARGHGRSAPIHDPASFTYPALTQDLIELCDVVGWDRAIFTGSSMGAGTIARLAMLQPGRPVAVVMVRPGSGGGAAPEHLQTLFRFGASALRHGGLDAAFEFLMTIPEARDAIQSDPQRLDGLRRDWARHDPQSIAAALEGIPASAPMAEDVDPGAVTAPVLIIPGNDSIHPTQAAIECARVIRGAQLAPVPTATTREGETTEFVETVRAFLKENAVRT